MDVGKASVLSAQARVESAQLDLGYCDVRAPISGLIGAKQVSMGELVGKGQPTLLATISTLDPIWFYCNVSEVQYLKAEAETRRTGKQIADLPVTLILANGSVHPDKGKFVFIDRAVDVKTGTLRVRAEFPNRREAASARDVRPDQGGPGRPAGQHPGAGAGGGGIAGQELRVGHRRRQQGDPTRRQGGRTDRRERADPGRLKAGERIVVEGLQKVREGAPVQPMTAAQMAQAGQAAQQAERRKQARPSTARSNRYG